MNIDFTKKYYFKSAIENYIKNSDRKLFAPAQTITGIEIGVRLGPPENHAWVDFDKLVSEDALENFIDGVKNKILDKSKDAKNIINNEGK